MAVAQTPRTFSNVRVNRELLQHVGGRGVSLRGREKTRHRWTQDAQRGGEGGKRSAAQGYQAPRSARNQEAGAASRDRLSRAARVRFVLPWATRRIAAATSQEFPSRESARQRAALSLAILLNGRTGARSTNPQQALRGATGRRVIPCAIALNKLE